MAYASANGDVYVSNYGAGTVSVISGATNAVVATVTVGSNPADLAYDSGNGNVYVVNYASNTVSVISGATNAVVATVTVGTSPFPIVYDSGNGNVYVANFNSNTVSVISGATNAVVATVTVGTSPEAVAYDSGNGEVYVANTGSTTVSVISGATNAVVATVPVGATPRSVAYDSGNGDVYVANFGATTVSVISGATNTVVVTVTVGSNPIWVAYDSGNGDVYVANDGANTVSVVSGATNAVVATVSVGTNPFRVAYDSGNGDVYVTNNGATTVSVISGATNAVVATVTVGTSPFPIVYDSGNGNVYVANGGANTVSVISTLLEVQPLTAYLRGLPVTGTATALVTVGTQPYAEVYDSGNGDVYAANSGANTVSVISGATNAIVATVTVGASPYGVAYDSGNGDVYVANYGASTVSVISGATNAVVATVTVGATPLGVAYDNGNGNVYVANSGGNTVSVISGATNAVVATVAVGTSPYGVGYDSGNGDVYVANYGGNTVSVISGTTNAVVATISAGTNPFEVGYDSGNGDVYVSNYGAATVSVISGATNAVVATVTVGTNPFAIVYDSGNGDVYVANFNSNSVSVISGATNAVVATIAVGINPAGVAYDSGNGDVYVANFGASTVSVIPTLSASATNPPASLDLGQSILLDAALLGQGAGGDLLSVSVSPSTGMSCSVDPLGESVVSAACQATSGGIYRVTLSVQDSLGTQVSTSLDLAVYSDPSLSTPTASSVSVDVSQAVTFSVAATGGTGTYTYSWTALPGGCPSQNAPSVFCQPIAAGIASVQVSLVDSNGFSATSPSSAFTVYSDPSVGAPTDSAPAADVGQTVLFSAVPSGGSGSNSYAWSGLPLGCNSVNDDQLSCTPTSTSGSPYSVGISVTDSNGYSASSSALSFAVSADPTIQAITASRSTLDVGQALTLTTTATAGSGTPVYSWSGLPTGCLSSSALTIACSPSGTGTFAPVAHVRDSNGMNVSSPSVSVTVSPALATPTFTLSRGTLDVGQTSTLTASMSGGTGSYTYAWNALPAGCVSSNAASIACTPSVAGNPSVSVTVSDTNGASGTSVGSSLTISPDPTIATPSASPAALDVSQVTTLATTATSGSGTPVYFWSGLPSGCLSSSVLSLGCSPGVSGTFTVVASVRDSNGWNVSSSGSLVLTVSPALATPTFTLSRGTLDVGQTSALTASASGGTGSYTYTWNGLPSGCVSSNAASIACTPSAAGTPSVSVTVSDTNGASGTSAGSTLTISPDPTISTIAATSTALDLGQLTILTATATSGSGTPVYSWSGLPTGCLSSSTLWLSCTPTSPGTYTVSAHVKDSNGWNATSGSLTLTVSSSLATPTLTLSRGTLDVGQTSTLTTLALGGTGIYTYTWNGLPSGCVSSNTASIACTPSAAGSPSISVSVSDTNGASTSSAGAILTISLDPTISAPTATRQTLDVGQGTTLTATDTSGSGTPVVSWSGLPTGCLSANSLSRACTPTASGTFVVTASVIDSNGWNATSGPLTLTVSPALGVPTVSATRATLDVGQSVTFTATTPGGSGGTTYVWSVLPTGCGSANSNALTCTPSGSGTFGVVVTETDSSGASQGSVAVSVTVSLDPTISTVAATRTGLDVGQGTTLSATASSGSGTPVYSWSGLPTGCLSANALLVVCTPTAFGTFTVAVSVRDSNGVNVSSSPLVLTVSSLPTITGLSASTSALDVGQGVTLSATGTSGSGGLTFTWSGLPAGCSGANTWTLGCTPTSAGAASVGLSVTDSNGGTALLPPPVAITVSADPTAAAPTSAPSSVDVGQALTFTTHATPGSGGDVYAWWGLPAGCLSRNAGTLTCTPSAAGSSTVGYTVQDSNGDNVSSGGLSLLISALPTLTGLSASVSSLDVGQGVRFTATGTSGSGGLTFAWSGLPAGCVGANSWVLSCSPTLAGPSSTTLSVTDSNGGMASWGTPVVVTVYADPTVSTPIATPASVDASQTTVLSASASAPAGGAVYSWTGLPAGCTGTVTLTVSCTPGAAQVGTYSVVASVSDANGMSATSSPTTLTVSPLPTEATLTVSRSAMDVGQTVLFTATGTSGSGGLTFTWSGLPAGCSGASAWTVGCAPTAAGTSSVSLTVVDSNGGSATAASPVAVTVSSPPTAALPRASPSVLDAGGSVILQAYATVGSGGDVYAWWGLPLGCLSSNSAVLTCSTLPAGSFGVGYSVQDSNGVNVSSGALSLTVAVALATPSLTATAVALDVGGSTTLMVSVLGGSAPLSYTWRGLPSGCVGQDAASVLCSPTQAGPFVVSVQVVDASGATVISNVVDLMVSMAPTVGAPSAAPASLDVGNSTTLTVSASAGTSWSTLAWWGLPPGCSSANASSVVCSPTAVGTYQVWASITDANGVTVIGAHATLTVSSAIGAATLTSSSTTLDVGQSLTLSVSVPGGSGGLHYTWRGLPSGCVGQDAASVLCTPTGAGSSTVVVSVSDSSGATSRAALVLTVNGALAVALSATPTSGPSGTTVTFAATVSGGTGTVVLVWYLNGSVVAGASGTSYVLTSAKTGTYTVWVQASDGAGAHAASSQSTVEISAPAATTTPAPSSGGTTLVSPAMEDSLLGILGLLVVVALLLVVLLMRVGGNPPPRMGAGRSARPRPAPAGAVSKEASPVERVEAPPPTAQAAEAPPSTSAAGSEYSEEGEN